MIRTILLDAGPLGLLCAPSGKKGQASDCKLWLAERIQKGSRIIVPEITDYEVRRELIRAGLSASVLRLDALSEGLEYLPLTTVAMKMAAKLWATARQAGNPTAGDKTIDADVILAGQALTLNDPDVRIATTNVGHLSRFVLAEEWQDISDK